VLLVEIVSAQLVKALSSYSQTSKPYVPVVVQEVQLMNSVLKELSGEEKLVIDISSFIIIIINSL